MSSVIKVAGIALLVFFAVLGYLTAVAVIVVSGG